MKSFLCNFYRHLAIFYSSHWHFYVFMKMVRLGSLSLKTLKGPLHNILSSFEFQFYFLIKAASPRSDLVAGRTRTKDKYRVVYSDHQRLELEKEFHYSRYITIRRKSELAQGLGLSERQVRMNIVYRYRGSNLHVHHFKD